MKFNFFKYIFILIAIALIGIAIYKFKINDTADVVENKTNDEIVKEISVGIAEFDSFNPYETNNKNMQEIVNLVYSGVVDLEADFKPTYILAEYISKETSTKYVVNLKDNLKFSDGSSLTVDDVIFSYEVAKQSPNIYSGIVNIIDEMEKIDDKSFCVNLNDQTYFIEYILTFPIVKSRTYENDLIPVGIGKYYITDYDDTNITLKVNRNFIDVDEEITLEKINIVKFSNLTEMYNKFKLGGLDVVSSNNENIKDFIGKAGYNEKKVIDNKHIFLALNTYQSVLQNAEVRKAILYAIDKDVAIDQTFGENVINTSFPLDYGSWLYSQNNSSSGYNLETAKELLVKNGYVLNKGIFQKTTNGKKENLTFKLLVNSSNQDMINLGNVIIEQLNNFGIMATVTQVPIDKYIELLDTRQYDIALCEFNLDYTQNLDLFFGENNLANYSSDELTDLLSDLEYSTNEEKIEIYNKFADIYKQEGIYLSIGNRKKTVAYNQNLAGNLNPNWFNPYNHIYSWYK